MNKLYILLVFALIACSQVEPNNTETVDTTGSLRDMYVGEIRVLKKVGTRITITALRVPGGWMITDYRMSSYGSTRPSQSSIFVHIKPRYE